MTYVRDVPVEPERGTLHGRALLEGKIIHIRDVLADPDYTWTEAQRLGGFRTILAVPMLREGAPIGVLSLTRSEVRLFTNKQIELVTTFADQAAIAVENVRLFEEEATARAAAELARDSAERARAEAAGANHAKSTFLATMSHIAHDFNNILTAIIGHCDLMLMRHSPGDSDYDDIQQIKSNSNRAAGLTRQLLAFSRQQTLRPQVLQLPDVVSEVSHLLKRLLGETVELVVKHRRNLGPIRADPGQLEQVIVNLAVNARDAMAGKEGGTLNPDLFGQNPPGRGTGVGHPAHRRLQCAFGHRHRHGHSTKRPWQDLRAVLHDQELGKGTGLGLSTVYGIVKQSGGFIFAEFEDRRRYALRDLSAGPSRRGGRSSVPQERQGEEG